MLMRTICVFNVCFTERWIRREHKHCEKLTLQHMQGVQVCDTTFTFCFSIPFLHETRSLYHDRLGTNERQAKRMSCCNKTTATTLRRPLSSDHGAINSWDRLPYVTDVRDGKTPSTRQVLIRKETACVFFAMPLYVRLPS